MGRSHIDRLETLSSDQVEYSHVILKVLVIARFLTQKLFELDQSFTSFINVNPFSTDHFAHY